jgi:hypothetical protein
MAAPFDTKTKRAIEKMTRDNPGLTHKELAAKLALDGIKVSSDFIYKLRKTKCIPFDFTSKRITDRIAALNVPKSQLTVSFLMATFPDLDRRYAQKIAREARGEVNAGKEDAIDEPAPVRSILSPGQRQLPSGILTRTGNRTIHRMF